MFLTASCPNHVEPAKMRTALNPLIGRNSCRYYSAETSPKNHEKLSRFWDEWSKVNSNLWGVYRNSEFGRENLRGGDGEASCSIGVALNENRPHGNGASNPPTTVAF